MIYLDNNATTKPLPAVTQAVLTAMESLWGNPSSIHRTGQEARHKVDIARDAGGCHREFAVRFRLSSA